MAKRKPAVDFVNAATSGTDASACTITMHVPIDFRRRGGHKTLTAPDGSSAVLAPSQTRVDSALVKAIARAFRWRSLIESGVYASIQEIAATENINDSYVGRVVRLTLLAPCIIESGLDGSQRPTLTIAKILRPFPAEWQDQAQFLPP